MLGQQFLQAFKNLDADKDGVVSKEDLKHTLREAHFDMSIGLCVELKGSQKGGFWDCNCVL